MITIESDVDDDSQNLLKGRDIVLAQTSAIYTGEHVKPIKTRGGPLNANGTVLEISRTGSTQPMYLIFSRTTALVSMLLKSIDAVL